MVSTAETPVSLDASYEYCTALTRAEARNFYYAFGFLPPRRRRGIYAVYAYSRRLDDIVDGDVRPGDYCDRDLDAVLAGDGPLDAADERRRTAHRLDYMRRILEPGELLADPLAAGLQETIARFRIPLEPFHELVEGMVMDLDEQEYRTFEDLRLYCYRAAATVGLICVEIFGHEREPGDPEMTDYATSLGLAMQLTNIIRDVREDLDRERVYLPRDELERFGVTVEDLRRGAMTAPLRELLGFQVERARDYFKRSTPLYDLLLPESRHCPMLLRDLYQRILDKIERAGFDVFSKRPGLSRFEKLGLVIKLWASARLRRSH